MSLYQGLKVQMAALRRRHLFYDCPIPEQVPFFLFIKKTSFPSTESFNIAFPSLFLPYRRAAAQPAGPNDSEDAWGILEVQSVSPPNQRSWFFTEGEIISGKPCQFLCREADANYIGGQTGSSL